MKNVIMIAGFLLFSEWSFSQYQMEKDYIRTISENQVNTSFTYKHLSIYPLLAGDKFVAAHRDIGKYTSLKDALDKKKIKITETASENRTNTDNADYNNRIQQSAGAQVNKLFIQNISKDTIYVMAGEIIKGGKQDRVLAQDMILPPNSDKVDISVYCVEQGRWSGSTGQFDKYFSVSSNSVRKKVIKDKNQSAVWEEVSKTVEKNNTKTNTGTYTSLVNSEEYNKEMKAYLDFFINVLAANQNCIGFVGVSGNRIIGCDIFATTDLFRKQSETILKGYITEAITNGNNVKISYEEVWKYLNDLLTREQEKQNEIIDKKGGQFIHKSKKIHITTF